MIMFPSQFLIIALGLYALLLVGSDNTYKNVLIGTYLGLLWIWTGFVYHIVFFTEINKAAYLFGILFIVQGFLILIHTLINDKLNFATTRNTRGYSGIFLILFGLVIYPAISYFVGNSFGKTIAAGLPCPTTILTFGFFMLANSKFPKLLLIIPSLWAIVGLSAVINLGVYQDLMLIISAIIANIVMIKVKTLKPERPYLRSK